MPESRRNRSCNNSRTNLRPIPRDIHVEFFSVEHPAYLLDVFCSIVIGTLLSRLSVCRDDAWAPSDATDRPSVSFPLPVFSHPRKPAANPNGCTTLEARPVVMVRSRFRRPPVSAELMLGMAAGVTGSGEGEWVRGKRGAPPNRICNDYTTLPITEASGVGRGAEACYWRRRRWTRCCVSAVLAGCPAWVYIGHTRESYH